MRVDWAEAALAPEGLNSENMGSHPTDFVPVVSSRSKQIGEQEGGSQNVFSLLLLIPLQVTPAAIAFIYTIFSFSRRF